MAPAHRSSRSAGSSLIPRPVALWSAACLLAVSSALAPCASAGPHAGGVLHVHTDDTLVYTADGLGYDGSSLLECPDSPDCPYPWNLCSGYDIEREPTTRKPAGEVSVFWVLAEFAWPPEPCARLSGVSFAIDYDMSDDPLDGNGSIGIRLVDWGPCADFELPGVAPRPWPEPGSHTQVVWTTGPQRSPLTEVYWFAGYSYATGAPSESQIFALRSDPGQGIGVFVDDSIPGIQDEVTHFGAMGFGGAIGYNPSGPIDPPIPDDLRVWQIDIAPEEPVPGDTLRVRARIGNANINATVPTTTTIIYMDGTPACTLATPSFQWTTQTEFGTVGVLAPGRHVIRACADAGSVFPEHSESNNCLDREIGEPEQIYIPGDLVFEAGADSVEIPIHAANTLEWMAFSVRVPLDPEVFVCRGISVEGTRAEGAYLTTSDCGEALEAGVIYSLACPGISPGNGPILKLLVDVRDDAPAGDHAIALIDGERALNRATGCDGGTIVPTLRAGSARVTVEEFVRGDLNDDGGIDISDPVSTLGWMYAGGAPPGCADAADVDDSGTIDLGDAVYSLAYQFRGGPAFPAPFPECGPDPTPDTLRCDVYDGCFDARAARPAFRSTTVSAFRPEDPAFPPEDRSGTSTLAASAPSASARMDLTPLPPAEDGTARFHLRVISSMPVLALEARVATSPQSASFVELQDPSGDFEFLAAHPAAELQAPTGASVLRLGGIVDFRLATPLPVGAHDLGVMTLSPSAGSAVLESVVRAAVLGGTVIGENGSTASIEPGEWQAWEPGEAAASLRFFAPNPFRTGNRVLLELPDAAEVRIDLFDVQGRLVRRLYEGSAQPGILTLPWDGRRDDGAPSGSGLYYARASIGEERRTRKFLYLRAGS